MSYYIVPKDELYHHGIQGQKWGVRRGPPYPIENKVLAKGTKLNSVSYDNSNKSLKQNKDRWLYGFNPEDEWDSTVYKGPFSYYKRNAGQLSAFGVKPIIYEHQYEVVQDLKMPTSKERIDEFINLYKNKPSSVAKDLLYIQNRAKMWNVGSKESQNVDLKKLKTEADYKAAYELFGHAMENVEVFKTTKRYAKIMSTKYDAMVDDNNVNIYNEAHDPVIVFNKKMLKEIGDVKMVTFSEMMENTQKVSEEMAKKGKKVLF